MISGKGIKKKYGNLDVLKSVDIQINKGEVAAIAGASGAGKSTLLHILGTLEHADEGSIRINGIDVSSLSFKKLSAFRNEHIGFVFQFHHLLPEFNASENVAIPAMIQGVSRKESVKKADRLIEFFGLSDRRSHKPSELSGGEQQRLAVARALINDPAVVLADEPSGNLDSKNALELHKLFFDLRDEFKQTFVIVTHNKELAEMSDRLLVIKDGILAT